MAEERVFFAAWIMMMMMMMVSVIGFAERGRAHRRQVSRGCIGGVCRALAGLGRGLGSRDGCWILYEFVVLLFKEKCVMLKYVFVLKFLY